MMMVVVIQRGRAALVGVAGVMGVKDVGSLVKHQRGLPDLEILVSSDVLV